MIYTKVWDNINKEHLSESIEKTFKKRSYNNDMFESLRIIKNSNVLKTRWNNYSKKNSYANDIAFEDTIKALEEVMKAFIDDGIENI